MKRIYACIFGLSLLATACVERGSNNTDGEEAYSESNTEEQNDFVENRAIEEEAFNNSPYFDKWDTNRDKKVDEQEFYQNYFSLVNKDGDDALSKEEWQQTIQSFLGSEGDIKHNDFSEWDTNGDGSVQSEEFMTYLKDADYFSEWNDGGGEELEEKEFAEGVFAHWDTDNNGVIEAEEFTEFYNKTGDGI